MIYSDYDNDYEFDYCYECRGYGDDYVFDEKRTNGFPRVMVAHMMKDMMLMNGVIRGMNKHVYAEWGDFQIRPPTYFDGHFEPDQYDIVKWRNLDKPVKVRCWDKNEYKVVGRTCFSIGFLIWDPKELHFKFESVGTRYLEERKDGLEKFILDFCEKESTKRVWENIDGDE